MTYCQLYYGLYIGSTCHFSVPLHNRFDPIDADEVILSQVSTDRIDQKSVKMYKTQDTVQSRLSEPCLSENPA